MDQRMELLPLCSDTEPSHHSESARGPRHLRPLRASPCVDNNSAEARTTRLRRHHRLLHKFQPAAARRRTGQPGRSLRTDEAQRRPTAVGRALFCCGGRRVGKSGRRTRARVAILTWRRPPNARREAGELYEFVGTVCAKAVLTLQHPAGQGARVARRLGPAARQGEDEAGRLDGWASRPR